MAALERVVAEVAEAYGLAWMPSRTLSARETLRRAMERAGAADEDAFRRLLTESDSARTTLLEELTVGESYFFRENTQLEFIRRTVLPDLRARRPPNQGLRVWSAGCASGEEPYTLAMILRQEGLAPPASILGTDVSRHRLAAARRGRYTPWALRATPPPIALTYFRKVANGFVLDPEIRTLVEFRTLNLAQGTWPSPASGIGLFDLIVCRNVLIYFSDAVIRSVTSRFVDALAPGGWLCFGASDPPLRDLPSCETFATGAGLAHRRSDPADPRPVAAMPLLTAPEAPVEVLAERVAAEPWPEPPPAAYVPPEIPPAIPPEAPRLDIEAEALHPERHHARAIVLESEGRLEEAVAAARQAVFLDPDFAAAHLLLGIFLARTGHRHPARRSLARATRLLAAMPPDARPAGADGEPARVLLGLARAHLGRQAERAGES